MGIHIVVCIKQTPATSNIQIDPVTGTLKREGMAAAINPFDEYGIEEAVRIKERLPGTTVSVVTMGPPQAEESLREAIARGADQAFHLTSRAFAGADTWATSYTLFKGIQKDHEGERARASGDLRQANQRRGHRPRGARHRGMAGLAQHRLRQKSGSPLTTKRSSFTA
jgi:hypothetical protein